MNEIRVLSLLIRLDGGGAERSVDRMVAPLARMGVRLTRYAIDEGWPGEESDPEKTLISGEKRGVVRILVASVRFAGIVRKHRPDVIHLNCEAPELVGLLSRILTLGQSYGIVVTDHSMKSWSGSRAPLGRVMRAALQKFGAVYVNCFQPDATDSEIPVIYNPAGEVNDRLSGGDESPRLIVIGRLIDSKRVDLVLEAASSASWPNEILVIGAGEALSALQTLAGRLDLQVRFLGHQKDPWAFVRKSDIFVTASAFEGEPLTLIEALQRELPILVSDIPGHTKVLGRHPGIFQSGAELSRAINECLKAPDGLVKFKLGPSVRKRILAERDPDNIASQWRSLYASQLPVRKSK